jgi:hypothetical protein
MKPECAIAVGQVLGRQPTEAELRNIEERLARSMRLEAAKDPQAWLAQPMAEQVKSGAVRAASDLLAEASLKQQRRVQQVVATARLQGQLDAFPGTPFEALAHVIAFHADAKGGTLSIESQAKAIERDALRQMLGTLEATHPKFFGLFENQAGVRDLVRELHGEATGNADAKAGAAEFHKVAEALRNRFNRAGGDVGQLDDWGMPHHHSQLKVAQAASLVEGKFRRTRAAYRRVRRGLHVPSAEQNRNQWIADVLPRLDRSKYLTKTGQRMDDAQVVAFLTEAWRSIATGGANKIEPGLPKGIGMRANRGNESRQVHFKSADDYLAYQAKYGERTPYEVLLGHIAGVAKDIALVETFGPNPDHAFALFRDRAYKTMAEADPANLGKAEREAQRADNLYRMAAGKSLPVANPMVAQFFDGLRNLMVASKLGSAVLSAISDEGTMRVAARVANLPAMQLIRNELAAFNPANRVEERLALRAGLAMNTIAHSLNRFGNEGLGAGWSSKIANTTLRLSGLNAMTDARRRAYGVTMMGALGGVVRDHASLAALDRYDHRILLSKGVTPEEFAVWKLAPQEDWGGGNSTMLTPEAIYRIPDAALVHLGNPQALREQAATKLLGIVLEETDVAVIEPGIRERAMMMEGLQRGTLKGELTRSFFLFKSFPIAMITKHWARAFSEPTRGGRAAYLAELFVTTSVLGMVALQASQVTQGKDPRDMTEWKTWAAAISKGGALSIYGDFFFSDQTQYGNSALSTLAGPVAGLAEDAISLTLGAAQKAAKGQNAHEGANLVRVAKANIPGANLWYARAAFDHLVFHRLQEYFSPGYLNRMKRRARKEFQQTYWWEPGQPAPKRAPDLEKAVGAK